MISVAKPWLICGYHGLTIVTMFFFALFMVKPWLTFVRDYVSIHVFYFKRYNLIPQYVFYFSCWKLGYKITTRNVSHVHWSNYI